MNSFTASSALPAMPLSRSAAPLMYSPGANARRTTIWSCALGQGQLQIRVAERVGGPVAYRRRKDQQSFVRRVRLQVGGLDRQLRDVLQGPQLAVGERAKPDQRGLGPRPVGSDRIAEMKQRLRPKDDQEQRNEQAVGPARKPETLPRFGRGEARGVSKLGIDRGRRTLVVGRADDGFAAIVRWLMHGCERLRVAQGNRRRPELGFGKSRLVVRPAQAWRQRNQRELAVEHGAAMAAAHLTFAHRELLRTHAENRLAAGAARVFFFSHDQASASLPSREWQMPRYRPRDNRSATALRV